MENELNRAANIRSAVLENNLSTTSLERSKALLDCLLELHRAEKAVIEGSETEEDRARRRNTYYDFWVKQLATELKQLELQTMIVQVCTQAIREYGPK